MPSATKNYSSKIFGIILSCLILASIIVYVSVFQATERPQDHLNLWFFDVGQGDATLIDAPGDFQVLIDGGPDSKILERLRKALPLTDKTIDLVIVTHNHSDHLKGITEILKHYQIGKIWINGSIHTTNTYKQFLELIKQKNIPTEVVYAGITLKNGLLEGIVIYPKSPLTGILPTNHNATSIVTYWQFGSQTFLLTGDIGIAQEEELITNGVLRRADILKVAHQGSTTSSSEAFLRVVSPKQAVIMVGKNSYGHPSSEVLRRLESLSIEVLQTDKLGSILFELYPDRYQLKKICKILQAVCK